MNIFAQRNVVSNFNGASHGFGRYYYQLVSWEINSFRRECSNWFYINCSPNPNFDQPATRDPNFKFLESLVEPYWTQALLMDGADTEISQLLINNDRSLKYSFPIEFQHLPIVPCRLGACRHKYRS